MHRFVVGATLDVSATQLEEPGGPQDPQDDGHHQEDGEVGGDEEKDTLGHDDLPGIEEGGLASPPESSIAGARRP